MCLNPQRKKSNGTYFNRHSYQSFYLEYPCGKCAECLELKKTQWYARCYWQAKECFDANGFIVFDTITYDDAHLKHISDFMPVPESLDFSCFDYRDVAKFLKRLRRALSYRGFDVQKNLKYFISSEYGHGDLYQDERGRIRRGTFRPHYHILFFVRSREIPPVEFSELISSTWQQGRNDGVVDKGRGYFMNHNLFSPREGKSSDDSLRRVCNYVAKYVTKDPDYQDMIDERVNSIIQYYVDMCHEYDCSDDFTPIIRDRLALITKTIKSIQMFHRQSVGFGAYALNDWYNIDEIWREGTISVPDREKVVLHICCPKYYKIKLFYNNIRLDDGSYRYELNDDGREFRKLDVHRIIDRGVDKMTNWYLNLNPENKEKCNDLLVNKLTGEIRDFRDVVIYRNIYRGRIVDFDDEYLPSVDEMIDRWNLFCYSDSNRFFPHFSRHRDVNLPIFDEDAIRDYYDDPLPWDMSVMDIQGVRSIADEHYRYCNVGSFVINSSFNEDWNGFDEFIEFYDATIKPSQDDKQEVYDQKEKTKKLLKNLSCFSS